MEGGSDIASAVEQLPLDPLRAALGDVDVYVVGGVVRDIVGGIEPGPDVDLAFDGDPELVLERLGREAGVEVAASHGRFGTATVLVGGASVDLARTRSESYPAPGALPHVSAAPIATDLARRDFTVNSMAVPLSDPARLLDPCDGRVDLRAGTLRVLHGRSFLDDPTRAIRAARYASRLGLEPDPATLELLRATDLASVSADRRRAELGRLAAEATAARGFALLEGWGLMSLPGGATSLIAEVDRLAATDPWASRAELRAEAILLAARGGSRAEAAARLAAASPERPSEAVRLAATHPPEELLLAQAGGGAWIADYQREWRSARLEIDGADLIAAGIPEGPAVGAGLRGALERKLDGGLHGGRKAELECALELARRAS